MHLEPREKHPFKDAEVLTIFSYHDKAPILFAGWRWPHLTSWGECQKHSRGFILNTIGMDGVE